MKVVSFSLWGDDPKYWGGLEANAELCARYYPGWAMRVYCERRHIEKVAQTGCQVRWRELTRGPWEGLFWRFEPIGDENVERFVSRDLDSRLNPREAAAVAAWEAGGQFAHVMRDHPEHDVAIVGGMWGCKHFPEVLEKLKQWTEFDAKGCDQRFLEQHIWPKLIGRVLIHDSAHRAPGIEPFPPHPGYDTKRLGAFVGAIVNP